MGGAVKWTKDRPTVPGLWWIRRTPGGSLGPCTSLGDDLRERRIIEPTAVIVDLLATGTKVRTVLTSELVYWSTSGTEWAGPIAPPEEVPGE